jgi:hypothetical protein
MFARVQPGTAEYSSTCNMEVMNTATAIRQAFITLLAWGGGYYSGDIDQGIG